MCTPYEAFITMEQEDGYNVLINRHDINIFGGECCLYEAAEVSDVKFEN
jgi:hypothetical protein